MPRGAEVTSDSESERVHTGSTKKTYASKKRRAVSASESDVEEVEREVNEEPEDTAAEGEDAEEEEEEYEIEKILDAKKGQFPGVSAFVVRHSPVITNCTRVPRDKRAGWGTSSSGKIMERSITAGWMREMRSMSFDLLIPTASSLIPSQKCKGAHRQLLG